MLKEYSISVVSEIGGRESTTWLVGEGDGLVGIPNAAFSNNSFHVTRTEMTQLILSERKSDAKIMTPKNMQSWLGRLLAQLPYVDLDVKEIRITEVAEYRASKELKWISIANGRLPEKFQECIVLDKNKRVHNWIHDDALLPLFAQYTHWMPLPSSPELPEATDADN